MKEILTAVFRLYLMRRNRCLGCHRKLEQDMTIMERVEVTTTKAIFRCKKCGRQDYFDHGVYSSERDRAEYRNLLVNKFKQFIERYL